MFTTIPGVSACLSGTLVTYANSLKRAWLGVDAEILQTGGAVSEECVHAMLEGALNASKADIALATSGIAGPEGGSAQKPVGTVFVGVGTKEGVRVVERLLLQGDRQYIQHQSAYHALRLLLQSHPRLFL
jgi:nicotinamide-nucleotide amidase